VARRSRISSTMVLSVAALEPPTLFLFLIFFLISSDCKLYWLCCILLHKADLVEEGGVASALLVCTVFIYVCDVPISFCRFQP
jgi:hypothetical protein